MPFERKSLRAILESYIEYGLIVLSVIAICLSYAIYHDTRKRQREVEDLKFVTTVVRDGANPCRITVVRKNARETISYSAILEGCKQ